MSIRGGSGIGISRRAFALLSAGLVSPWAGRAERRERGADPSTEFLDVPNEYRMRMHWFVFGPAWEPVECRRQLAHMAEQHIGGVLIFPTYPIALDDPARGIKNLEFLSPEFLSVLRSVCESSRQLGLTVDIVLGTGWPYGGPSVSVEDGARLIRMSRVLSEDPAALPDLGTDETRVAVLPDAASGEALVFTSAPTQMHVKRAALGAEGLVLDHYNRAALERYLHAVGDKLLGAVPRGGIRSIFCDSLEVYRASWTEELPAVFRSRRGYDLIPHLPALFAEAHPDARDVRCDFWRTLSEQVADAFVKPLQEWAHQRGVTTQVEAYGTPPANLASYQAVDTPVGEHYEWKEFCTSRWASSGAHLAGKRTILTEAWTWTGLPNRFADTLEQLKLCSDLHFLCGMNALYGLTYAYSPEALGSPGWVPYFGPAVNHTSPYWPYFSHLADYVNRVSYVLQQGLPVADIALYLPEEDCMADAPPEELLMNWAVRDRLSSNGRPPEFSLKNALHFESSVVKTIVTNGYSFDGIDTFTLASARVQEGRLRVGHGDYSVLILPNLAGVDVESMEKIVEFVNQGGTVIATRRLPETSWGLERREEKRAAVKSLVARLFGKVQLGASFSVNRCGRGRAFFVADELGSFRKALEAAQSPDIRFVESSEHVSFVHRRTVDREHYFLANTSTEPQSLDAEFRVGDMIPELWDHRSGNVEPVPVFEPTDAGVRMRFSLGPFESRIYTFVRSARPPVALESSLDLRAEGPGWKASAFSNGGFKIRRKSGTETIPVTGLPAPVVLAPRWRLQFENSTIAPMDLDSLSSWTELKHARFFSGRGIYTTEFDSPFAPGEDLGVILDLGRVHETADVHVNGQPAGVAWMRPYRLDVSRLLRLGRNTLQVAVTNLLINKILGDGPIDYSAVHARYGNRFRAGEEWDTVREPFPSGLLGPLRLVAYRCLRRV